MNSSPFSNRRRTAVGVALGACLVAAPAGAAIAGWSPQLSRSGVDASTASAVSSAIPGAADNLGVLRRAQSAADRTLADPRVAAIGGSASIQDVQLTGARAVSGSFIAVPVNLRDAKSAAGVPGVCTSDGDLMGCAPTGDFKRTGLAVSSPAASGDATFVGLVPDGVVSVRFVPDATGKKSITTSVANNFFQLTATGGTPAVNTGVRSTSRPPQPPSGHLEWLSAAGEVVGPKA